MCQVPLKHFMWIATLSPHNTAEMLLLSILQNFKKWRHREVKRLAIGTKA